MNQLAGLYEADLSRNLVTVRHSQMRHSIQGRTLDEHLRELILYPA